MTFSDSFKFYWTSCGKNIARHDQTMEKGLYLSNKVEG